MRRGPSAILALLASLLLSAGLAACGGQEIAADEVPGPPPTLTTPAGEDAEAADLGDAGDDAASDEDEDADPDATPDAASGGDDTGATTGGTSAPSGGGTSGATGGATPAPTAAPSNPGGASAPAQDDSANDTAPPPGSGAEKFEEFCQQNAGAC